MRDDLQALLGGAFPESQFVDVQDGDSSQFEDWLQSDLTFVTSGGDHIPARFLRPAPGHAKVPAVIYCHAHGDRYQMGRAELTEGRSSLQGPYGPALKSLGCASLCLDMPCFGGRQTPVESELSKTLAWHGKTLFGQMLSELQQALGFLSGYEVIDANRLGALGFSMGSTHAWWLAALDPRVKAAAALCSFADLKTLIDLRAHDGHGHYMTVPGLVAKYSSGEIAGFAAPRALMICAGLQDWSTPASAFEIGRKDLETAFAKAEASDQLSFFVDSELDHRETPEMRQAVLSFLQQGLVDA